MRLLLYVSCFLDLGRTDSARSAVSDDNIAQYRSWVHPQTVAEICKAYSRDAWAGCFHDTMKREIELKPWSCVSPNAVHARTQA